MNATSGSNVYLVASVNDASQATALPYHYMVLISGRTDLVIEFFIGTPVVDRVTGARVPIMAVVMSESRFVPDTVMDASDDLPDGWQERHGLDPTVDDASLDPDLDLLDNLAEFQASTNPLDDDTDGGGEHDWTELTARQDAIKNPDDDQVNVPTGFRAEPGNGLNVLRWDVDPTCADMLMYASTLPNMAGATATPHVPDNSGVYADTGLTNGTTTYYKLACRDSPHVSGFTNRVAATPKTDIQPPDGTVVIDDGANSTASLDVALTLSSSPDAAQMISSNASSVEGASWEAIAQSKPWTLEGLPGRAAFAHVAYRDATGNVSDESGDGIM